VPEVVLTVRGVWAEERVRREVVRTRVGSFMLVVGLGAGQGELLLETGRTGWIALLLDL
jgi:hypothetical protein